MESKFEIGDIVETIKGAKFWGETIAFDTDEVSPGCTVRAIDPGFEGTKHVYPLVQIRKRALQAVPAQTWTADMLASTVANIRQGKSSTPRCEPPGGADIAIAKVWTALVLEAMEFYTAHYAKHTSPPSPEDDLIAAREAAKEAGGEHSYIAVQSALLAIQRSRAPKEPQS